MIGTLNSEKNGIATNQNTIAAAVMSRVVETIPNGSLASR